jgi:hypothetical protein
MQNPQLAAGDANFIRIESTLASPHVMTRSRDYAVHQPAGAAGPVLLAVMHQHVDRERAADGAMRGADAPAKRELAARATPRRFQDDTAHTCAPRFSRRCD